MAIIKFAAPISAARGTIGGTVFSANGSGPYIRSWRMPSNPQTPAQMPHRGQWTMFPSLWSALSSAQRADWAAYAADPDQELTNSLGEPYYANAYNWFVRINGHLLDVGESVRDDPPSASRPAAPTLSTSYIYDGDDQPGYVTLIGYPADEFLDLWVIAFLSYRVRSGPLSAYRMFRLVCAKEPTYPNACKNRTEILNAFGAPTLAFPWYYRVQRQDDEGQRSLPSVLNGAVLPSP